MSNRKKKRYLSADDYLNLTFIILLLIISCQFTIRLFIVSDMIFKSVNIISLVLLVIGLFCLYKFFCKYRELGKPMDLDRAIDVLERYKREHKLSKKLEDIELISAISAVIGVLEKEDSDE